MNLDQIATKCFILALFIRDDGQRLLLGDGYYDFNQKLQHFQGNTIANDVVEIQGDNGQLLAGQVMRSGTQKFEGYIGDATTSRQTIEQKRSDFMAFFRIKHFYKVIYIFPDGTAIQRQRGYLTDAPTIPEIFQRFPEYSVALNFEDANYYEYAEDAEGNEIYAHIAELALSGNTAGGLIWDEIGAVSNGISWSGIQTAQGEYISITNALSLEAPLASVEMLGNAEQAGTPTPASPQPISDVTGENVVKIEGKNLINESDLFSTLASQFTIADATYSGQQCKSIKRSGNTSYDYPLQVNGQATISFDIATGTPSNYYIYIHYTDGTSTEIANGDMTTWQRISATSVANKTIASIRFSLFGWDAANIIYLKNCQLELGSTATAYEPYQGQEFEVNLGKNLLPNNMQTQTLNGVTFTVNDDKSITMSGTATARTEPRIYSVSASSSLVKLKAGTTYYNNLPTTLYLYTTTYRVIYPNSSYTPTADETATQVYIRIENGETVNTTIYPMLTAGAPSDSYAPYFTPIELAKIGNYQDRIFKADSKWYIEKQVGKIDMADVAGWALSTGGSLYAPGFAGAHNAKVDVTLSNIFVHNWTAWAGTGKFGITSTGNLWIMTGDTSVIVSNVRTWLSDKNAIMYYILATPTTTEITNEALIAQLEALGASSLYLGVNNIGTETQNAMPTLKIEYYTEVDLDGAGYEWEPGGNTAKTIVTVAGVDSAWPIWTVQGGAQNPTLTNITTGQTITWQGFVPEGQTLTINMAEMTADLAGANVFEYITGEWLRLAPGNNTLVYNAGNADEPSTLSWNGVLA